MRDLFTDKELDELDSRYTKAVDDKWDAYNHQINLLTKRIAELEAQIKVWKTTPIGRLEKIEADNERLRKRLDAIANAYAATADELRAAALENNDKK